MRHAIAACEDDAWLAECYRRHWVDMGVRDAEIAPDWRERFIAFVLQRRRAGVLAAFAASVEGRGVGCAVCHIVERRYPAFRGEEPAVSGYIWCVWVDPACRRAGIGRALVGASAAWLRERGCARALLHAGEGARSLYLRMGFAPTDELALGLGPDQVA